MPRLYADKCRSGNQRMVRFDTLRNTNKEPILFVYTQNVYNKWFPDLQINMSEDGTACFDNCIVMNYYRLDNIDLSFAVQTYNLLNGEKYEFVYQARI